MKTAEVFLFGIILLPLLFASGCGGKGQNETNARGSLNITVDPRIELLAVVQFLSGYGDRKGLITKYEFPYKRELMEYFSSYKNHHAVKLFTKMSTSGFWFQVFLSC